MASLWKLVLTVNFSFELRTLWSFQFCIIQKNIVSRKPLDTSCIVSHDLRLTFSRRMCWLDDNRNIISWQQNHENNHKEIAVPWEIRTHHVPLWLKARCTLNIVLYMGNATYTHKVWEAKQNLLGTPKRNQDNNFNENQCKPRSDVIAGMTR